MYKTSPASLAPQLGKEPEHFSIARQFANEAFEQFNPSEQNEIVKLIRDIFKERRMEKLSILEDHAAELKESLSEL